MISGRSELPSSLHSMIEFAIRPLAIITNGPWEFESLHPQAQLSGCGSSSYPISTWMEDRHCRHCGDAFSSKLGELASRTIIDIYESVHVANTESLGATADLSWRRLPVRSQDCHPSPCLVVMWYCGYRLEVLL